MAAFVCDGLGAREVYDSRDGNYSRPRQKFFVLDGVWLAAMEGAPPTARTYQHVAFWSDRSPGPTQAERRKHHGEKSCTAARIRMGRPP